MRYYSSCLSCGFKSNIKRDSSHRFFQTAPPKTAVCLPVRGIFSDELNQSQLKKKKKSARKQVSPTHAPLQLFFLPRPNAQPHTSPDCRTLTPTHALMWPLEKPVTVSGPLPWEDKLPVKTATFCGIHIRGKNKGGAEVTGHYS